ncbi:hypothetical protein CAEBREN_09675 [Caenorhabditis brenneri]|uniref:Uncharacterized protein n=1 Tax=Caenorhabditis brenneri TaxID=135651 RepID=G0NG75_CAEBE|nr:hypothetical protein CAEBREN_09675 [Caenorhabditis brenneri]
MKPSTSKKAVNKKAEARKADKSAEAIKRFEDGDFSKWGTTDMADRRKFYDKVVNRHLEENHASVQTPKTPPKKRKT